MSADQSEKKSKTALKEKKLSDGERASSTAKISSEDGGKQSRDAKKKEKKQKRPRRRVFPIWMRIIVVSIFAAAALIFGLMIGYGVIGDGTPTDALKKDTWQHIIDLVTKPN